MPMFRLWGKLIRSNKMLRDYVFIDDDAEKNRTRKVFDGLEAICREFNLGVPLWLDGNISDFKKVAKTRFSADSFMEEIDFDYLEIQVIEED